VPPLQTGCKDLLKSESSHFITALEKPVPFGDTESVLVWLENRLEESGRAEVYSINGGFGIGLIKNT
jgi:hypothetical protein